MTNDGEAVSGSHFKDRKTGLVVFGILEILLGAICSLMVIFMIIAALASAAFNSSSAPSMSVSMMIPALLFYILLAIWFIWMGIGSIKARRWARALLLVTSWLWLIMGAIALIFVLMFLPDMYDKMGKSGQISQEIAAGVKYVVIGFTIVIYVIIPGALVLFYGSKHVKETCARRDPQVRWTDNCPLPVLAVSLMAGCSSACMPLIGFHGWSIPFFGLILSGMTGAGVALMSMVLFGYVAWGAYKLNVKAWWCAVALIITWGISGGITFSRMNMIELYERMHFPAQQLEMMKQFSMLSASWSVLYVALWTVVALGYLLYTKRFFTRSSGHGELP